MSFSAINWGSRFSDFGDMILVMGVCPIRFRFNPYLKKDFSEDIFRLMLLEEKAFKGLKDTSNLLVTEKKKYQRNKPAL